LKRPRNRGDEYPRNPGNSRVSFGVGSGVGSSWRLTPGGVCRIWESRLARPHASTNRPRHGAWSRRGAREEDGAEPDEEEMRPSHRSNGRNPRLVAHDQLGFVSNIRRSVSWSSVSALDSAASSAQLAEGQLADHDHSACDRGALWVSKSLSGGRLAAGRGLGSERPNARDLDRPSLLRVRQRRSTAFGRPMTHESVPRCSKPGTRQASVPDHEYSRTAPGREILVASFRSSARRMGGTSERAGRS
jgi:hypothetical protein